MTTPFYYYVFGLQRRLIQVSKVNIFYYQVLNQGHHHHPILNLVYHALETWETYHALELYPSHTHLLINKTNYEGKSKR